MSQYWCTRALTRHHEAAGVHRLRAPCRRHAHREEGLYLGGEVEGAPPVSVEERLDAEAVPRGEQTLVASVPDHEREFPPQLVHAFRPQVLVQMERDLAVG